MVVQRTPCRQNGLVLSDVTLLWSFVAARRAQRTIWEMGVGLALLGNDPRRAMNLGDEHTAQRRNYGKQFGQPEARYT
jgi:hypothetical protein